MNFKKALKETGSRILRFIGIIALIYVSMVFYLALSERRNAFPRAISHNEARAAIQGEAKSINCTLEDGTVLNGWTLGEEGDESLLYYPDADEDAAQFLAEMGKTQGTLLIAFNYRGSADNKGTPSQETFESDAKAIAECANQVSNGHVKNLAGRGTGAILAAQQLKSAQTLVLIDPIESIADALERKYRVMYPKFLVRASVQMPLNSLIQHKEQVKILFDRKNVRDEAHILVKKIPGVQTVERGGDDLKSAIVKSIQNNYNKF